MAQLIALAETKMGRVALSALRDPRCSLMIDGPIGFGRLAQRESTAFTRQGSLVRTQHRPPLLHNVCFSGTFNQTSRGPNMRSVKPSTKNHREEPTGLLAVLASLPPLDVEFTEPSAIQHHPITGFS